MAYVEKLQTEGECVRTFEEKIFPVGIMLLFAVVGLTACGDAAGTGAKGEEIALDKVPIVDSFGDLVDCDGRREGLTSYVKKDNLSYVCEDGEWVLDEGKSSVRGPSSSSRVKSNSSSSREKADVGSSSGKASARSSAGSSSSEESGAELETDLEKDTYGWGKSGDGDVAYGSVTYQLYVYDAEKDKWRPATSLDSAFGGCTVQRAKDISRVVVRDGFYWYVCRDEEWLRVDACVGETYVWKPGEDGEIRRGDSLGIIYKYDKSRGLWLEATEKDIKIGEGCTVLREHEIVQGGDSNYFGHVSGDWKEGSDRMDFVLSGRSCSSENVGVVVKALNDSDYTYISAYYCSDVGWIDFTVLNWNVPLEAYMNSEIKYGTMTDSRDGQEYKTVDINGQTWMAQNLNYADSVKTPSLRHGNWCYNDILDYCKLGGRLYSWSAAIDSVKLANAAEDPLKCGFGDTCSVPENVQGICPSGWHLPSGDEVRALGEFSKSMFLGFMPLVSVGGWHYDKILDGAGDSFGFSMLPMGYRDPARGGFFNGVGSVGVLWTTGQDDVEKSEAVNFTGSEGQFFFQPEDKRRGFSVRCVKD